MGLLAFVVLVFMILCLSGYNRRKKNRDKTQPIFHQDFYAKVLKRERNDDFYLVLELLEKSGQQIRWKVDAKDYTAYRTGEEMTIRLYSRDGRDWYSSSDWEVNEGIFGEMLDMYTLGKLRSQKFRID